MSKKTKKKKTRKSRHYQPPKAIKALIAFIEIIQIITAIGFMVYFYQLQMWPLKYLGYVLGAIVICVILAWILKHWKWGCVVSVLLSICMIGIQSYGAYIIFVTNNTLQEITDKADTNTDVVCVLVMSGDKARKIADAKEYKFGILSEVDRENTDATVEKINSELGTDISTTEIDNMLNLVASLYSGNVNAIFLNYAYVDIINEFDGYRDFSEKIRVIYANKITTKMPESSKEENETESVEEKFEITEDAFNIYISGIDVSGDVTTKSRSDVNIIMSVNPKTKQILLVSTPRDYYVPLSISGGVKDKLTHAGLYGVDVSMETLEQLYGIDIDYFVRMNFSGFTDIINVLGGIEVYSEYSFSAKGYHFKSGYNTLMGEAALVFARERKSFASGDNQRGKNQMEVIKAVINKAESSALLENYKSVLDSIGDSMQTNISATDISKLVKMQLKSNAAWDVVSYSVTGAGQSQYTFTVPNARAYVMVPNENAVDEAKQLFTKVENGESLNENK